MAHVISVYEKWAVWGIERRRVYGEQAAMDVGQQVVQGERVDIGERKRGDCVHGGRDWGE